MHIAYAAVAGDLPPENTVYRDISLLAGEGEVSPAGKGGWLDTVMHVLYDITRVETMRAGRPSLDSGDCRWTCSQRVVELNIIE